ncbi:MAG: recombination-associated protein RdgC [Phycisphaerae bacterium]
MAFASGPVSFQRFFMASAPAGQLTDAMERALAEHAFGQLAPGVDDVQIGWVGPRHLMDADLSADRICVGRFLLLALRIDRLRVPGSVLKSYVRQEEEDLLRDSGRDYLSKGERKRCREAALERAEKERKSGSFRRMSAVPVLVDLSQATAYLGNTGAATSDKLMQLFRATFSRVLEPADAATIATKRMLAAKRSRALEHLAPAHLVRPPDGYSERGELNTGDLSFLGREFLSWLWYHVDADEGPLRVSAADEVAVMIDKVVRLKCDYGLSGATVVSADGPTHLPETKAALRVGKQPTRMGLVLGGSAGEFRLTLDAARMTVSGLTLPEAPGERTARDRLEERLAGVADVANLLDALFEMFLLKRTDREWAAELRRMSAWASAQKDAAARAAS